MIILNETAIDSMNSAQIIAAHLVRAADSLEYNVQMILLDRAESYREKANSVKSDAAKKKWNLIADQYAAEAERHA
jgi:hypothetical protein